MSARSASEAIVFVVEPDTGARERLCTLLRRLPAVVRAFADGGAFLRESDLEDSRSCLICELDLPDMSALQLLERMNARGSGIPALVLAHNGDVSTAVRAMRAGAVDFIEKPYADGVLVHRVREALRRRAGKMT